MKRVRGGIQQPHPVKLVWFNNYGWGSQMPEGFSYSDLNVTEGTLGDPEFIGSFDKNGTEVKVWKYPIADPQAVMLWQRALCEKLGLRGAFYRAAEACSDKAKELG